MQSNQRWFTLKLDEGWEPLKIVCRIFDTNLDLHNYVSKFTDELNGPACTLGFKNKGVYAKIEICFNTDYLSKMIFAHEIAHATHMYVDYFTPEDCEEDTEEWFCIVNGWLTEEFHNRFEKVFDIIN